MMPPRAPIRSISPPRGEFPRFKSISSSIPTAIRGRHSISRRRNGILHSTATPYRPARSSEAVKYITTYQTSSYLSPPIGYWLKFSAAHSYVYSGRPLDSAVINARTGWNLIGVPATPVLTGSITQVPAGIVTTPYFGYQTG